MKFNHEKFFDGFKAHFDDSLDQDQVDGIEFLLTQFEAEPIAWNRIWKIAYGFATTFHETAGSMQPVEEAYYLEKQYSRALMIKTQKGFRYYPYFGRGYPQTTWITNYKRADKEIRKQRPALVILFETETRQKFDLINKPEQMKHPLIAFATMTLGMAQGWFTGKKLSDFAPTEYDKMRTIINGRDKAGLIAGYARLFEKILRDSVSAAEPASVSADTTVNSDTAKIEDTPPPTANIAQPEPAPMPESLTAKPTDVVEVEQVAAAEAKPDVITRVQNRFLAIPGAILAALGAAVTWATSAPINLIITLVAAAGVIVTVYIIINAIRNSGKEQRETELKKTREAQAFELQKLTLQSAMSKDLNTVRLVPTPIANSDEVAA